MFDAEERLVLANDRYAEIYGLEPGHLRPGHDAARAGRAPHCQGPLSRADRRRRLAATCASASPCEARTISSAGRATGAYSRSRSIRAHEGGWVVTLQDITEREELNARLKEQNDAAAAARGGAGRAEYALRCRHQQHVAGHVPVRCAAAHRVRQRPLRRDLWADARAGEAGHDAARDLRGSRGARAPTASDPDGEFHSRRPGALQQAHVGDPEAGRWALHLCRAAADARRRPAQHARGHHRARAAQRPAHQAERAAERSASRSSTSRNEQLDAALDNMLQGLAMYDSEQRLVMCNKRYAEMYGLVARAGEARHAAARDHRASHRQG